MMSGCSKKAYTTEFKELAVKRVADGDAISVVVKELGLSDQTLRNWIKAASEGKLKGADTKVITPVAVELSGLRAEMVRLKRENDIIKKAAAGPAGHRKSSVLTAYSRRIKCQELVGLGYHLKNISLHDIRLMVN